jgi:hypothetical protein
MSKVYRFGPSLVSNGFAGSDAACFGADTAEKQCITAL